MEFFISHCSRDRDWVELVRKRIEDQGFKAYLAEYDQQIGTELNAKIEQRIQGCDAFVVILTENAAASSIVNHEIGYAKACGKTIVPLVASSIGPDPAALGILNGVEYVLFDIEAPEAGLLALTEFAQRFAREQETIRSQQTISALTQTVESQLVAIDEQLRRQQQLELQRDLALALLVFVGVLAAVALLSSDTLET